MNERGQEELELLRQQHHDLECREQDGWCRLPHYHLPDGWSVREVELAFQIPEGLPGQAPYAFWTKPQITLANGAAPGNTQPSSVPGFGDGWQQWSWQLDPWTPGPTPKEGTNMGDFVRSFGYRLQELG